MDSNTYKGLREMIGYSADEMAAHHGVSLKTQQRWENGHRDLPVGVVHETKRLAREFMQAVCTGRTVAGHPEKWYRLVAAQRLTMGA